MSSTKNKMASLVAVQINCLGDLGYSHTRLLDTVTDVTIPNRLHEFSLEGLSGGSGGQDCRCVSATTGDVPRVPLPCLQVLFAPNLGRCCAEEPLHA